MLGVILIPMLFVLVGKLSGSKPKTPTPEKPAGVPGGGGH
jgi:hypothetical protein